jgi:hypothetical protein
MNNPACHATTENDMHAVRKLSVANHCSTWLGLYYSYYMTSKRTLFFSCRKSDRFSLFFLVTLQHTHAAERIYALASVPNPAPFYSLYYFGDYRIEYVLMAQVLDTRINRKWE